MRKDKANNYNLIMDTAIALFNQKGYDQISINEICEKSGVSRSTFYNIFKNKDDLISSFFDKAIVLHENYIPIILSAENDLERLWIVHELFLNMIVEAGSDVVKQVYKINLDENKGSFDDTFGADTWYLNPIKQCQSQEIIRSPLTPEKLYFMMINFSIGLGYQWCANEGNFDVKAISFPVFEDLYDIAPEYRNLWQKVNQNLNSI
ncbi:TetR/AcrR family transcriptional regulator [Acetobacterium sp. K1/6]|uniref:TetR/AcrR family transcriptional regulator n=1 Tax=Acetobacterium sp. K1/6 TaxID=3055467 RepID=UPI002ACA6BB5|nr:TetR/AcrR family transcriptional regulator [Acetobacterium sp. K1/6]MDZ5726180.1 TetR/AcrR family transcriptional regulator [Acetobacterium sp. K1/6]